MSGVTSTGYLLATYADIRAAIESDAKNAISAELDTSDNSPLGQIISVLARALSQQEEMSPQLYGQFDRDTAEGVALDNLAKLLGLTRIGPTATKVAATLNLNASTTVPAGSQANMSTQPNVIFTLDTDVTSTTSGNYAGNFTCQTTGPIVVNASALNTITVPVTGWNSVTNSGAGTTGTNQESDAAFRLRMISSLNVRGACTPDAIVQDVLNVPGVLQCKIIENTSAYNDSSGRPPKSYEVIVWDGSGLSATNANLGTAIWKNKPAGIQTVGATSVSVLDIGGTARTVYFSRATELTLYINITIITSTEAGTIPSDVSTQVKNNIASLSGTFYKLGTDVYQDRLKMEALLVSGVAGVSVLQFDTSPAPTNTATITVADNQIVTISTANITVTVT